MSKDKVFSWRDGLPTAPDVALLQKVYADIKAGDRITYEEIGEMIGLKYPDRRFTTVTNVWRKRELERGVVIDCEPGEAFIVIAFDQCAAKSYGTHKRAGRLHRKQRLQLATFRPETDDGRRTQLHLMQQHAARERDAKKDRMNLLPPTEMKSAPRIGPPQGRDSPLAPPDAPGLPSANGAVPAREGLVG